ncbi:MAG: hypothetical protein H7279_04790 [Microbacteriaceae bacterium]|nr:hypothetical protein [Microbacteriaceae bacterium]
MATPRIEIAADRASQITYGAQRPCRDPRNRSNAATALGEETSTETFTDSGTVKNKHGEEPAR